VTDEEAMHLALEEARAALKHGDVPVGAVVVKDAEVIARACNEREFRRDPTAHAEVVALQRAAAELGRWRLDDCTLYVTLEPCTMCAGATVLARLGRLVYGPQDRRAGAALSLYNVPQDKRLNHRVEITSGVLAEECAELLQGYFRTMRG
jgi:tRNA(adenine34) deaminase